jgi:putative acetyltransferase
VLWLNAKPANYEKLDLPMMIKLDDLRGPEIAKLLEEHLEGMRALSPPESVHALDLDALRKPEITFWTAWDNGALLGCGAIKQLDATHAEVKSMRTAAGHLRKGVAAQILERIVEVSQQRGYRRLSLETGSMKEFAPAHALYASFGFEFCGPFADYAEDPHSVFMTKKLT